MNIAIDIDDTLTDSFSYFQRYVAEFFGVSIEYAVKHSISYSTLPAEWKERDSEFCKSCYDSVVPFTPFKTDAAPALKALHDQGHRIIILTGRDTSMYTDPYETSKKELGNGMIVYDKLICSKKKADECKKENIDILIDDLIENCESASKNGVKAIVFTSPENAGRPTHLPRANSWREVLEIIDAIGDC